jgi:hypothetical protein
LEVESTVNVHWAFKRVRGDRGTGRGRRDEGEGEEMREKR